MSLESYWSRVRELLTSRGGVKVAEEGTSEATYTEKWEVPVKESGKLLVSIYPHANTRAIYQCFDSRASHAINLTRGFRTPGVSYGGLPYNPFSGKCNFLGSRDQDLQRWEAFILEITDKPLMLPVGGFPVGVMACMVSKKAS